mmetsp:Transcript_5592/g.12202  ORF Transcript_5592/g.12202 Transcript_5592/m.12202 type:complete len:98 (+) Transcript_5592:219-512(+)
MDLLGEYNSNSENDEENGETALSMTTQQKAQRADRRFLRAAPSISIMTKRKHGHELIVHNDPNNRNVVITEPIQGISCVYPWFCSEDTVESSSALGL